ncbi:O-antigen ligase family protein [Fundicoccus culcitae]|uniref:O-antigen ligase family protein n=1 Tax=Fundicoccus culcitae TaxID=2969821 RepID=A0ABY5P600_9LACT|nr:O-antigen ligase family protein [Fundicoccus culcitae]UUX34172.1 O-antigen ligase family protein [Fundicoccus culcitae]
MTKRLKRNWHSNMTQNTLNMTFIITTIAILLPFYIGAVVMLIHFVYLVWINRKSLINQIRNLGWIGFFILYAAIVSLANRNYIGLAISLLLFLFAIYFSSYLELFSAKLYVQLLKTISIGSLFVGLYNIINYIKYVSENNYSLLYILQTSNPQFRAEATFFNANYYGLFCIFALLICIYLWNYTHSRKLRFIYGLTIIINFISIIMTASRMLLPTVVIATFVLVVFINKRLALTFLGIGILGVVVIILNPSLFPRFESLAYGFEDRLGLWNTGWNIFLTRPLTGRGPLAYVNFYYLFINETDIHSHQLLIDSLANYGLFGIFILFNALIPYFRKLIEAIKEPSIRLEVGLILAFIVAVVVHGLVDVSIFWLQTGFVFLVVCLCPTDKMEEIHLYQLENLA